jgi:hypothetical protein
LNVRTKFVKKKTVEIYAEKTKDKKTGATKTSTLESSQKQIKENKIFG